MKEKVKLLALFFSKQRVIDSPHLDYLLELDDLANEIYQKYRIKKGFGEATLISYESVINKVLES